MKGTIALILAGGQKPNYDINILSRKRAKAAIPFGGAYRIIDFVLTNLSRTTIPHVGIMTQHLPESLMDHIMLGQPWGFHTLERDIKILPPYLGRGSFGWYKGTADALYQNLDFIEKYAPEQVLVLSGDHIYQMDYAQMVDYHRQKGAQVTIAARMQGEIPPRRFGVMRLNFNNLVTHFEEKPEKPSGNFISLGIYVFDRKFLVNRLQKIADKPEPLSEIAYGIIEPAARTSKVYAYPFQRAWEYLATIDDYWAVHMSLMRPSPPIDLKSWKIVTNPDDRSIGDRPPTRFGASASVENSIIGDGAVIDGTVSNSVIFPGVCINSGAHVDNCVVMHDVKVGGNSRMRKVVVDKDVFIGDDVVIGESVQSQKRKPTVPVKEIAVVAKSVRIYSGSRIGKGCYIDSTYMGGHKSLTLSDGENIK